ncbi:MAG: hypothetical protein EA398_00290 [Deltaproteobacteria bacterium]|nr:MAG: hypothetical protein EA398_00290 [Deltaproteobacteria bacterium]
MGHRAPTRPHPSPPSRALLMVPLRRRSRAAGPLLPVLLLAVMLLPAAPAGGQVLHEFFTHEATGDGTDDEDEDGIRLPMPGRVAPPSGDAARANLAPLLFHAGGIEVGGRSSTAGLPTENAPHGPGEDIPLDLDTRREGQLRYVQTFTPSVAPWKRLGARDAAVHRDGQWLLGIADPSPRPVPIDPEPVPEGYTRFTARITARGQHDALVPLPSVAPDMRVHEARTDSEHGVRLFRDSADNLLARIDHAGPVTLHMVVSAPDRYLDGILPQNSGRSRHPAPAALARDASRLARHVGLDPDTADDALIARTLQRWFLDFVAEPFPDALRTGNDFLDIGLGGHGVCRHRAHAFALTAIGLGLRARMVYNEAHAFTEVLIRDHGWVRVDLGGDAEGFEFFADDDTPIHQPASHEGLDPAQSATGRADLTATRRSLEEVDDGRRAAEQEQRRRHTPAGPGEAPHPPATSAAAANGPASPSPSAPPPAGDAPTHDEAPHGLSGAPSPPPADAPSGVPSTGPASASPPTPDPAGLAGPPPATEPGATPPAIPDPVAPAGTPSTADPGVAPPAAHTSADAGSDIATEPGYAPALPDPSAIEPRPAPDPPPPGTLRLATDSPRAERGRSLPLEGTLLRADGSPVRNATVDLLLRAPRTGPDDERALPLASATTDDDGHFRVSPTLPDTLPPGRWSILARWAGDDITGPTRSTP